VDVVVVVAVAMDPVVEVVVGEVPLRLVPSRKWSAILKLGKEL
jgi:hypothetical protein